MKHVIDYSIIPGVKKTKQGIYAWTINELSDVMQLATTHQWIVLGGDVLFSNGDYTYDNWYYEPCPNEPLKINVYRSIEKCKNYIEAYVTKNGGEFLFALVLSSSFVSGC